MNTEPLTKREAIALQFALKLMDDYKVQEPAPIGGVSKTSPSITHMAVELTDKLLYVLDESKPATDSEFDEALKELKSWSRCCEPLDVFQKQIALLERLKRDMRGEVSKGSERIP